ncbi:uncharacterized protein LOC130049649 [Ostrea edulis]|uniref:uncharacterized protein LOC130049649 n=1 Tax=Ostrea edulis TaxID=37623 RepID=UPI0024AF1176|nr:uncharacterized protein LOC130049649 [Ostrea edulis]
MVEQIPPYNQLDTVYILPPNYDRVGTLYLFLSQENTTATYPNNETKTIIAGREYGFSKRLQATVIRSADPILMTSYALEYVRNPEERAYWTVVPGVNQYLPRYKVMIPNGWDKHYVALMIRKSAVGGLRVNDQSIDTNTIRFEENVFVEDLEYSVIIAEVREGELTLESIDDTPFGLMAYGNREHGGYGFAGNVVLR